MSDELTDIRIFLRNIYDKMSKNNTITVGIEFFKKLMKESLSSKQKTVFILHDIYDYMKSLTGIDKKEALYLLPFIYNGSSNINLSLPYLNKTFQIIQISITRSTEQISPFIAGIFGEILNSIFIESHTQMSNENLFICFEEAKGFCFYLIKSSNNIPYQICGCLFLLKLIETTKIVYFVKEILQDLLKSIFGYLAIKKFYPRREMLQCLMGLIKNSKEAFSPFVEQTIPKIAIYLKDPNWIHKKIALNCLLLLISSYKDTVISSRSHILELLYHLKEDKVKDVRIISLKILKIFNEDDEIKKGFNSYSSFQKKEFSQSMKLIDRDKENFIKSQREIDKKEKEFVLVEKHSNRKENKTIDSKQDSFEDSIDMLCYQMKDIFKKQQFLVKVVDNINMQFQKSMMDINGRAKQIEDNIHIIEKLNESSIIKSQWDNIVGLINDGYIEKGFIQSLDNDYLLIRLVKYINQKKLKMINDELLEDIVTRLLVLMNTKKKNDDVKECIEKIGQNSQIRFKGYMNDTISKITSYKNHEPLSQMRASY